MRWSSFGSWCGAATRLERRFSRIAGPRPKRVWLIRGLRVAVCGGAATTQHSRRSERNLSATSGVDSPPLPLQNNQRRKQRRKPIQCAVQWCFPSVHIDLNIRGKVSFHVLISFAQANIVALCKNFRRAPKAPRSLDRYVSLDGPFRTYLGRYHVTCIAMGVPRLSEWRKLPLSLTELSINTTLQCGQSFRWRKIDDEWFV